MTDSREREESEWLVTSPGGSVAGLSGADEAFVEVAEDRSQQTRAGAERQGFGEFAFMWLGEKQAVQKKSEAVLWARMNGEELFRMDFAEMKLFEKFVRKE
ncbi:uncharacterized protein MONOS_6638 [Monocercomonoides exilis]|uniref:uncharacterized protein n=1 Tax=Monocercomonoides exilis TaxID=2049356 RepID=UPI00355ABA9D|nr:hypothetical protein MONOS_6638 [Monocercomonoides exilis]|eukprot:MONOS_6638.1-p1 / transcript=MONOS_6638.1 / gene=MONOS_6638 / organism=Monocercomonoides_exilis_PA203 / gene_product=unspecified product / transcript_product=unspecified product / location=Mono_scaffold00212:61228-61589(+) / protein_length=101 / sequence_SO=supercontig / SO=protein_coding / is_pseudo=false